MCKGLTAAAQARTHSANGDDSVCSCLTTRQSKSCSPLKIEMPSGLAVGRNRPHLASGRTNHATVSWAQLGAMGMGEMLPALGIGLAACARSCIPRPSSSRLIWYIISVAPMFNLCLGALCASPLPRQLEEESNPHQRLLALHSIEPLWLHA